MSQRKTKANAYVELVKGYDDCWHWRARGLNHRFIMFSVQRSESSLAAEMLLAMTMAEADDKKGWLEWACYEQMSHRSWRWHAINSTTGAVWVLGREPFASKRNATRAMRHCQTLLADARRRGWARPLTKVDVRAV